MRACSSALRAADLDRLVDQLGPGTLCLTVPLVDDVVQVGIGGDFATTALAVSMTTTSVRVHRLDGRPLQVHIVEDWRGATEPGVATPVFDQPVEALVFERCGRRWLPGPAPGGRLIELDRFVGTLTRFALAKRGGAVAQTAGAA